MTRPIRLLWVILGVLPGLALAHDGHSERTYEIRKSEDPDPNARQIRLEIRDRDSGDRVPARFSVLIDGESHVPPELNADGIHFTSIHARKKQRETVLYSRGTGPVNFAVPETAKTVTIQATRGLQYRPATAPVELKGKVTDVTLQLEQFIDLEAKGWRTADTHLHYERREPKHDADWLAMLDADGLNHGFFMVLKGGNFDDVWAQQFAYGKAGEGKNGSQLLVTGEEFRGTMQGHNNLFGHPEVLTPISVGGMGKPPHPYNAPSTHDVLVKTRQLGGIGGPAHGGTFGRASTALVDALNGASEFFELANTHLFETGPWYRAMNCGVILPPMAGTDLPNFPYRDPWQPFFGEVRTFVQCDEPNDFEAWKAAVRAGRVWISSGPLLTRFTVNGAGLGEKVSLPAGGGPVEIKAELVFPGDISYFELIRNGKVVPITVDGSTRHGIGRWEISETIEITESCWLAVRGFGPRKEQLFAKGQHLQRTMMHSAAIPVMVGDQPIRVEADVEAAAEELDAGRKRYETDGKFPDDASREAMLDLFDRARHTLKPER